MQRSDIIAVIDQELSTLQRVRELLNSSNGFKVYAAKTGVAPVRKRRVMSADARARIGLAQKRRWAKQHKAEAAAGDKK